MASQKPDVLVLGPDKATIVDGLSPRFTLHKANDDETVNALVPKLAPNLRAIAVSVSGPFGRIDEALMSRLPKLEIVSSFGVGYDHIDAAWAGTAWHHCHPYAGRAERRSRRHCHGTAALHRAAAAAGGPLSCAAANG